VAGQEGVRAGGDGGEDAAGGGQVMRARIRRCRSRPAAVSSTLAGFDGQGVGGGQFGDGRRSVARGELPGTDEAGDQFGVVDTGRACRCT
jgi:hypothetical protein